MLCARSLLLSFFILFASSKAFAQVEPIDDFDALSDALADVSTEATPIVVEGDILFTSQITLGTQTYIEDNNFVFDGGTVSSGALVSNAGSAGFNITTGKHVFNDVEMNNFLILGYGGAINNKDENTTDGIETITTINNSSFSNNYAYSDFYGEPVNYGGALDNFYATLNINDSYFYGNVAGGGAAISNNEGIVTVRNSIFKNNIAYRVKGILSEAGAIANYGELYVYDSMFEGNSTSSDALIHLAYGGAISNASGYDAHIYNTSFINNYAGDFGGAIHNDYNLYLYAENAKQTIFTGNTQAGGDSNAIHNTCYVALLASQGGEIIFNDAITSEDSAVSAIDIGGAKYNGVVVLNDDMRGVNGTTTFKNGTIKIGFNMGVDVNGHLNMFGTGMSVDTALSKGKAIFDMANNSNFDVYNTGTNLTLNSNLYANIDVDLISADADKFVNLADAQGDANVIIEGINITQDADVKDFIVNVSENGDDRILLSGNAKIIQTPMYTYSVSDANLQVDGTLIFNVGLDSSLFSSHSSKKVHATVLTDITKHVLTPNEIGKVVSNASSGDEAYEPSFWFDAKGLSEDVSLGGLTVDNDTYIAIGGFDFMGDNYSNWQTTYSVYGGYVGSSQKYEDIKTNQDGFVVGAGIRVEKDNIFSALTANFATSFVDGNNQFGNENFDIYSGSVASKTGMDYDLYGGKYVLTPSVIVGYHYVHTEDYRNASDIKIFADDLQVFHISPELKFVTNFENGFSPYVAAAYHLNIESGGDTKANDVLLPALSVDNYAEFAIGFGQDIGADIHTYAEAIFTSGDRTGGGAHIGLKWQF